MSNIQVVKGKPYFLDINNIPSQYNYLDSNIETEVVIIGGGVTGSILGYYFSKNNINAVILEKNIVAYGSTGITTALLQYELDETVKQLESYMKKEDIIKAYKLGQKALNEIEDIINEHGNKCDYKKRNTLFYTSEASSVKEVTEEYENRKENGLDVTLIKDDDRYGFDVKCGVLANDGGAEIDPYKFTREILGVAEDRGLKVYENTEVLDIDYNENEVIVKCKYGYTVKGKIVIVATGYNTKLFSKRDFGVTTTTYNIVTKPIEDLSKYYDGTLIRDTKDPYNYIRSTIDNRIIIGGEDVPYLSSINNINIANEKYDILENRLKFMFNKIKGIEIDYKYCGAFTSTQDNLGYIGKDKNNNKLWFNLGYGANGILFAILGGLMLSNLYKGIVDESLNLFSVYRFDN